MTEGVRVADFENEKGYHEPRNAGSLSELEKVRKQIIPYTLGKEHSPANNSISAQ